MCCEITYYTTLGLLYIPNHSLSIIFLHNSNINISKGGKSSFVVTANHSAGRVDIKSSNSEIVEVSESSVFLDMDSATITVSGVSVGSAKITVYLYDVTTYDDDNYYDEDDDPSTYNGDEVLWNFVRDNLSLELDNMYNQLEPAGLNIDLNE